MSVGDTSEMDVLESELSTLTITVLDDGAESPVALPVFQRYLHAHADKLEPLDPEDRLLVVLSPLSTKHAFQRQWVTKRELSSIVERPQRLLACSIGIAAAYSLHPSRFELVKSTVCGSLDAPHVVDIHGENWPHRLRELCEASKVKLEANQLEVPSSWPTGDIYLNPDTVEALEGVIGAIETAIDTVYRSGMRKSMIVVRPPGHHSHPCAPSGFCLLNNAQITIQYAYATQNITHAVILDIDLHHGDGSQEICWKRGGWKIEDDDQDPATFDDYFKKAPLRGPKVGYFSIHDINSYPTESGTAYSDAIKNASTCLMNHDVCIWNVHLEQYQSLQEFDALYDSKYRDIIRKSMAFLDRESRITDNFKPLVMISAGFDGSEYETVKMQRHQVNLPTSFYHRFTSDVCASFLVQFPGAKVVSILEGGYSNEALCSGIFSHLMGFVDATWSEVYGAKETVKELVKGCRMNWKPAAKNVRVWFQEVIELGRTLIPESIVIAETPPKSEPDDNILDRLRSSSHMRSPGGGDHVIG